MAINKKKKTKKKLPLKAMKRAIKPKSSKHSTEIKNPAKVPELNKCRLNEKFLFYSKYPPADAFIHKLCNDLIDWAAYDSTAFVMVDFLVREGIASSTFYDWLKKYPKLKTCYGTAKQILGGIREKGMASGKYQNASYIASQMPRYDQECKALEIERDERRAALRAKYDKKNNDNVNYTIVVDRYTKEKSPEDNVPEVD